jgi:ubiquinone/menaquinone biosynthesis C-methylase UbiE
MKPVANFDPVAHWYCWLEYATFGRALERCRFALLPALEDAQRVLILGEGDGRFLKKLLSINSTARIDVIEASAGMMKLARGRLSDGEARRVKFHLADARNWDFPEAEYDAIVTCFFLDCFSIETLARFIPSVAASIRPGGDWLVAEFRQPRQGVSALRARLWLEAMYFFFCRSSRLEVCRLPQWEVILKSFGVEVRETIDQQGGLLCAGHWYWKGNVSQIPVK